MKEHFEKFLGTGNASDSPADLVAYSYDGSELKGTAKAVLFPEQEEQLRLILTYCNRTNTDVMIRGNGSNPVGAAIPDQSVVVSMQGFDTIRAINVREGWVEVEAGVTLHELDQALTTHGYRYPLTPRNPLTTVGSFLARNSTTHHGLTYGRAVDTVKGLEIMDGTGKLLTIIKDFADYVGKEGTCFIITRAKLQIIERKPRSADIVLVDTLGQAMSKLHEILDGKEKPLSVEYLDSASATYLGISTMHTLLVEWESERGSAKHEQYTALATKILHARRRIGEQGHILMDDGQTTPNTFEQALRWCADKNLPVLADAGQSIIHPFFSRTNESIRKDWYEYVLSVGGSPHGTDGYGLRKKAYVPTELKTKLRQLKERHDYNNVLARGKLMEYI